MPKVEVGQSFEDYDSRQAGRLGLKKPTYRKGEAAANTFMSQSYRVKFELNRVSNLSSPFDMYSLLFLQVQVQAQ